MWTMGVPFEFVGQITGSRPMAEASDVESCATSSRHDENSSLLQYLLKLVKVEDEQSSGCPVLRKRQVQAKTRHSIARQESTGA